MEYIIIRYRTIYFHETIFLEGTTMGYERPMIIEFKRTEIPASRYAINHLRKEMSLDLSPIQCEIFIVLKENGGSMTQKDLEDYLDLSKSTLSGVLKTMEKNGFVEKAHSETDRRVMVVTLTDEGNEKYSLAMEKFLDLDRIAFAGLDEEEMAVLAKALEKIRSNIGSDVRSHFS